jgi:hypothetical protein
MVNKGANDIVQKQYHQLRKSLFHSKKGVYFVQHGTKFVSSKTKAKHFENLCVCVESSDSFECRCKVTSHGFTIGNKCPNASHEERHFFPVSKISTSKGRIKTLSSNTANTSLPLRLEILYSDLFYYLHEVSS